MTVSLTSYWSIQPSLMMDALDNVIFFELVGAGRVVVVVDVNADSCQLLHVLLR